MEAPPAAPVLASPSALPSSREELESTIVRLIQVYALESSPGELESQKYCFSTPQGGWFVAGIATSLIQERLLGSWQTVHAVLKRMVDGYIQSDRSARDTEDPSRVLPQIRSPSSGRKLACVPACLLPVFVCCLPQRFSCAYRPWGQALANFARAVRGALSANPKLDVRAFDATVLMLKWAASTASGAPRRAMPEGISPDWPFDISEESPRSALAHSLSAASLASSPRAISRVVDPDTKARRRLFRSRSPSPGRCTYGDYDGGDAESEGHRGLGGEEEEEVQMEDEESKEYERDRLESLETAFMEEREELAQDATPKGPPSSDSVEGSPPGAMYERARAPAAAGSSSSFAPIQLSDIYYVQGRSVFSKPPIESDVKSSPTRPCVDALVGTGVKRQNLCLLLRCYKLPKQTEHYVYLWRRQWRELELYVQILPDPRTAIEVDTESNHGHEEPSKRPRTSPADPRAKTTGHRHQH